MYTIVKKIKGKLKKIKEFYDDFFGKKSLKFC